MKRILLSGIAVAMFCAAGAQAAQPTSGTDFAFMPWVVLDGTEFHPVPGEKLVPPGDPPNHKYVQNVNNRIVDLTNPILKPWAKQVMEVENKKVEAGGVPFVSNSRCWPVGVPGFLIVPGEPVFYLQTDKEDYILNQRDQLIRRIFMNQPHHADAPYSWYGDSTGHYENGDTLVIDTIKLDDKGPIDRYRTPHSKQMHVVERHTLSKDGKNIRVIFSVDDPVTFNMPWKGLVDFGWGREPRAGHWVESICNENSNDYFIAEGEAVDVPNAKRLDF